MKPIELWQGDCLELMKNIPDGSVDLLEYLIRTYTNDGETVLDFTMGSGSTGVACVNTNRRFIGIEIDEGYFNIATQRIDTALKINNTRLSKLLIKN